MNSAWSDFFQQKKKHEKENEEKLKRSLVGVSSATMTKRVFRMLAAMHPTWIRHIQYTSPKDVRFLTYKDVWYLWSGAYRKFDRNHQGPHSFVGVYCKFFRNVLRNKVLTSHRFQRRKWKKKGFKNPSEALNFVRAKSTIRNRKQIKDYPQLIASYEKIWYNSVWIAK